MNLKSTLILVASLTACSFQTQASLCNGGFESGDFSDNNPSQRCWSGLTEDFGFREVITSYTDGSGTTFGPTEGSYFVSLWGSNDLAQDFSWLSGDQLSFDWITVSGTNPGTSAVSLFAGLFDGLFPLETLLSGAVGDTTRFNTFTHTFTQDSPNNGLLAFQAWGIQPGQGLTNEEVGHILIDNVQLTSRSDKDNGSEVPEPNTLFLMAFVFILGWMNHKTRKGPPI